MREYLRLLEGPHLLVWLLLAAAGKATALTTVNGRSGLSTSVDSATGSYSVRSRTPAWEFAGSLGKPLSRVRILRGKDRAGTFRSIGFSWTDQVPMRGSIRLYERRAVAVFTVTYGGRVSGPGVRFPTFTRFPAGLFPFRYSEHEFAQPPIFRYADIGEEPGRYGGPLLLFDGSANAAIVSPAANFMIAAQQADGSHLIEAMLNPAVTELPEGFQHAVVLVIEPGINRAWETWGQALTDLFGKRRPANDADPGVKYLSYWTDNGGAYYYRYDREKGYDGTLLALKRHYDSVRIPVRSLQLDSWWYEKSFTDWKGITPENPQSRNPDLPAGKWNRFGGLLKYAPDSALFPRGLKAFQQEVNLPLITHNRWIDPASPYHIIYRISGLGAVDRRWWEKIASDVRSWGVKTYEQDWLNYIYEGSPEFAGTIWAGAAFMDGMAEATAAQGLTMQYCMPLPRHFLQGGAEYSHLTSIRVSGDRFEPKKWREFLYTSRLASALGIWPFTDVFMSSETSNMILATLSAGMVGIGDELGKEDRRNILKAVRSDGTIVKPDAPIVPVDRTYIAEAAAKEGAQLCRLAAAYTEHGAGRAAGSAAASGTAASRTLYLFAYRETPGDSSMEVSLRALGIQGAAFVYDPLREVGSLAKPHAIIRLGSARRERHGEGRVVPLLQGDDDFAYRVVAPVGRSGMALAGDAGKYVMCGRKRIADLRQNRRGMDAAVVYAKGEDTVTLVGYSPTKPVISVRGGALRTSAYDQGSGIFRAVVAIDGSISPVQEGPDLVRRADVKFLKPPK